ncbi:hypothetical protein ACFE04_015536 [Oxalis oulophora]
MRFRLTEGSIVGVLSRKGAWICGNIVSGNDQTYTVRYHDQYRTSSGRIVEEKVPRTAIRPRPPNVIGAKNWVAGDFVEVFHHQSWKTAKVIKVTGFGHFYVRLIESSHEVRAHRSNLIRARQCWHNGNWFVLGRLEEDCSKQHDSCFARSLGPSCTSGFLEAAKRPKIMEKDASDQKVDAFVSSHKKMGENHMHRGFDNNDYYVLDSRIPVETVSCSSSVGSCSVNGSEFCDFSHRYKIEDYNSDDAESSSGGRYEEESKLGVIGQSSKLHAYRAVLEALYASGPMSWDEQEKMMDLRNALNISDDEHLKEIRNLISAK